MQINGVAAKVLPGDVSVFTTDRRGLTPEEWAEIALNKLLAVSQSAPEPLRQQAMAYRTRVRELLVGYMRNAIISDRTTIINFLTEAGHPELAKAVRSL